MTSVHTAGHTASAPASNPHDALGASPQTTAEPSAARVALTLAKANSQLGHAAQAVQSGTAATMSTPKIRQLDFEAVTDALQPMFHAAKAKPALLQEKRENALTKFSLLTTMEAPSDDVDASIRLGVFLAAKAALAGCLPDGTPTGKSIAWQQLSAAASSARSEIQANPATRSLPSLPTLLRDVLSSAVRKGDALAHTFNMRALSATSAGSSSSETPSLVSFDGRNYDVSNPQTAALLMLAAMPLDVMADPTVAPEAWQVTANKAGQAERVVLNRQQLWQIASDPSVASQYSRLSLQTSDLSQRPLQNALLKRAGLIWSQPSTAPVAANVQSRIKQGIQKLTSGSQGAGVATAPRFNACKNAVKSLWQGIFSSSSRPAPLSSAEPRANTGANVDMSSRRSRRQAIQKLVASINATNTPQTRPSTEVRVNQLFELQRLLIGMGTDGVAQGKDLRVFYSNDFENLMNWKGRGDKAMLMDQAEAILQKHMDVLVGVASAKPDAPEAHPPHVRAQAAFAAFPPALLNPKRPMHLSQFGLRSHEGWVTNVEQLIAVANADSADGLYFDASVAFGRLQTCLTGKMPEGADHPHRIDPLVLLDAVVDYRNDQAGEKNRKDYRTKVEQPITEDWEPERIEVPDAPDEETLARLLGSPASPAQQSLVAKPVPVAQAQAIQALVDGLVLRPPVAHTLTQAIGRLLGHIAREAALQRMQPAEYFDALNITMPRHAEQAGPSQPKLLKYDDLLTQLDLVQLSAQNG
ncbi:MAG TPA: hypothetical protein VFV39_08735 [Limnobacter sp.]|nr:hypothetical protein [Limnobacter sp.]